MSVGVVEGHSYHVKLPDFEGPFELLYHLLTKEKVNIEDIPLARIIEEYLQYLHARQGFQVDPAADFLVMAAALLHLKSRMLLPQPPVFQGEEEGLFFGSKEELVRSLLAYRSYRLTGNELGKREKEQKRIFLRSPGPPRMSVNHKRLSLPPPTLDNLSHALRQLKNKRAAAEKVNIMNPPREKIPFGAKMRQVLKYLKVRYDSLECYLDNFLQQGGKEERVVTFLVLLELAKRGRVSLGQKKLFGKIRILKLPWKTKET